MNDANDADAINDRVAMVHLYMEALKARMEPEQYEALAQAVHETAHFMLGARQDPISDEPTPDALSSDVQREHLVIVMMIMTGRTDLRMIEVPGPDGNPSWIAVEPETANDPDQLRKLRENVTRWAEEQRSIQAELDGIARASGITTDH